MLERWQMGEFYAKVPEGESPLDAWDRAEAFFQELPEKHPNQRILLCTHGRQLRVILSNLLGVGMQHMESYKHGNTGLSILHFNGSDTAELELLNDAKHLEELIV